MKNFIFFLIFPILSAFCQNDSDIYGTWKLEREESEDEGIAMFELKNTDTDDSVPDLVLQFNNNGHVDIRHYEDNFYAAKFKLKDSVLELGSDKYIIIKNTDKELILKEFENLFPKTTYYYKLEERIKSVPEKETIVETFENGNLKVKGEKLLGFQNGKWVEYYENGTIKSEKYFYNGIPFGIWKYYNEEGDLIKKENR